MDATRAVQILAKRLGYRVQKGPGRSGMALARLSKDVSPSCQIATLITESDLAGIIQETPRVHLGCGHIRASGYINIDALPFHITEASTHSNKQWQRSDTYYLQCEITQQLQLAPGSLTTLYSSHFFEHLDWHEVNELLAQCHQALKPGGCLRLAVPNFELWCRQYLSHSKNFFRWYRGNFLSESWDPIQTNCTTFNGLIYGHGHKSMFDLETLTQKLLRAGFGVVTRKQWGRSQNVHNIAVLEPMDSIRRHESLIVEAVK